LDNDKAFAAYALTLTAGLLTVLAFTIASGVAKPPPPMMFLEHLAMALSVRWAYKFYGGFDWADWSLTSSHPAATAPEADTTTPAGGLTATS